MNTTNLTNWLEIDLSQYVKNLQEIQKKAERPVMAVIKADAYGHGAVKLAHTAKTTGINWFAVARVEEAFELRQGGIHDPVLVLGYTPSGVIQDCARQDIRITIYDLELVKAYQDELKGTNHKLSVHLKIDSGMGRLGILSNQAASFISELSKYENIELEGMFTHFARADEPEQPTTDIQLKNFQSAVKAVENANLRPPLIHASNSAAILVYPQAKYDIVRAGIIQYGISPSEEIQLPTAIKPIMEWKTRLTMVKILPPNSGIGYGHRYITKKEERVGTLAVGYADGLRRTDGNIVLIRGKKAPVIGRVCMDQSMVQLDEIPEAKVGDEVTLIGTQGKYTLTASEIGESWGSIMDEVTTGLQKRVQRVYINPIA